MYNAVVHNQTGSVRKYGFCDFSGEFDPQTESQVALTEGAIPPTELRYCKVSGGGFVEMTQEEKDAVDAAGLSGIITTTELSNFIDANAQVVDPASGISGEFHIMQTMVNRRELYNDTDNPLYVPSLTPILGSNGHLQDHVNRINNLEVVHGDLGWHSQLIKGARYTKPTDILIYYGWLNSFNYSANSWNNEKVAQDMARYGVIVIGSGIADPSHGDYSNTAVIIPRIKALNPNVLIFGYVDTTLGLSTFQTQCGQWDALGVHGIFMDKAGYDWGTNRADFNTRVDYIHGQTSANLIMANAWTVTHILGVENDVSFPNSTYNSGEIESSLEYTDWILLESFAINTDAYTGTGGYEDAAGWLYRGEKATELRATYGVRFAASGVIGNANGNGNALYQFGLVSAMMFSLDAWGSSDSNYASLSAEVTRWVRPDVDAMGLVWTLWPSVQVDVGDSDVYWRYTEFGRLKIDFSSGAQLSAIISEQTVKDLNYDRKEGIEGFESYHSSPCTGTALTEYALAANVLYAMPFIVPKRVWADRISYNVTVAKNAKKARVGIYESNGRGAPGKLLFGTPELSVGIVGIVSYQDPILLTPGLKFLTIITNSTPSIRCFANGGLIPVLGHSIALGADPILGLSSNMSYGQLPTIFPTVDALLNGSPLPAIFIRFASW